MHALPQFKYPIGVHRGPPRSTDVQAWVRTFCVHQLPLAEGRVLMGWVVARTAQGGKALRAHPLGRHLPNRRQLAVSPNHDAALEARADALALEVADDDLEDGQIDDQEYR